MENNSLLILIPIVPLLGAFFAYLIGKKTPELSGWIATAASLTSFIITLVLVAGLSAETILEQNVFTWFAITTLEVEFLLRFDRLAAVMCLVVTGVGSLIHLYSVGYMAEDDCRPRYFSYLNLFMFSMLLLVLGGNLLVLFVGWEGVGLCSYLLIGFWFKNVPFAAAGKKAFVVNRIGDAGFLLGIFLLFVSFGTVDFVALQEALSNSSISITILTLTTLCLFIGATGKSAQIPLFTWLPDAMAGPTPVSALIHAATMVTAGVYMLARLHFLFAATPFTLFVVCLIAILTAFVAATTALAQNDIKKVLAYSTVSQLGFMFVAASVGAFAVAIFHVVTHAFFKACLFLGAGSVIHGCHHEQDMRKMGGLARYMPITFVTYAISTLAIAGIFPFAGYQSKHAILAAFEHNTNPYLVDATHVLTIILTVTAFLTAFYMTRSLAMTFLGEYKGEHKPHESPAVMTIPLIVLAGLATVGGLWLSGTLEHYLEPVIPVLTEHHPETILESIIHSWVGIFGVVLALVLYTQFSKVPGLIFNTFKPIGNLFSAKYYVDELYSLFIVRPLEQVAHVLWKTIDQGIVDGAVNGTAALVDVNGEVARRIFHTGQLRHYAFYIFTASVFVIVFYLVL